MRLSVKQFYLFILGLCTFSLAFAFVVEYIMHLSACPLCIYQRFPFLMLICVSICGIQDQNKSWLNWYLIFFVISIMLAGYHTGVERGIFEMSSFCKPAISWQNTINTEEFLKMLDSIPAVQCDKPALVVFGLSMTEWNLLLNLFLLTLTMIVKLRTK